MNIETIDLPWHEEGVADLMAHTIDMYLATHTEEELATAIQLMSNNQYFKKQLHSEPKLLFDILDLFYHPNIFSEKNTLHFFVSNMINYIHENEAIDERVEKRIKENPIATNEELNIGAYIECLEFQIQNAIKILRQKGYNTFESGYGNRLKCEQMIGFDIAGKPLPEIPDSLEKELKENQISIRVKDGKDRYQIILTPVDIVPSVAEWEPIWRKVAENMPVFDQYPAGRNVLTKNARDFYDEQMEMKKKNK